MSDNEYERFEITDYDLNNEFNVNRPRRKNTKHQQIYGIWADDSDNDSGTEERIGRRRRHGLSAASKKPKDYTAPVNFVAGGVQQAGKSKKPKEFADGEQSNNNRKSDDADEVDSETDARPAFGQKQASFIDTSANSSDEYSSDEEKPTIKSKANTQKASFVHRSHVASEKQVGAWEQHTRGIGAKLLLQMGYEPGKGLGKDLQGIAQPVQAHVRKGRGAIGAYGPEVKATLNKTAQLKEEAEEVNESKTQKEQQNKWRKSAVDKQKTYNYKTVEEVIEKSKNSNVLLSEKLSKKLSNVPVIDMTGPERRVLSGYHALAQTKANIDEELYELDTPTAAVKNSVKVFAMPELTHNLQLIVNMCEQDIIALDKNEREAADRQAALEHEYKNLQEIVKLEDAHLNTLEAAIKLVDELCDGGPSLTLQRAEQLFLELQQHYAAEYKEFCLGDLAGSVIAPLVKENLMNWQPMLQPTLHIELIRKWRSILTDKEELHEEKGNIFDPYSTLVWAGVIPSFRACADNWNPKQHQHMAALLDAWAPLFPTWILDSVLEQLILPRLNGGVRNWDPLTDTVPIHIWVLPWNSILNEKMEESIYPMIREKLGAALQAWLPQDRSARAMLTPWKGAFDDDEMQMFLYQHIIPKLQVVLSEFVINPLQQDLELWNQVWEWHELIKPSFMAQMLDKYFFPRWMQVLVLWLNQTPDYTEIMRWYTGWKSMFNEELLKEPCVRENLRRALEMMHRAADVINTPAMPITSAPTLPPPQPPPPIMIDMQMPAQLEFKELVSQKCSELGIIFAPLPGRREMGHQIYRVGKLYCYIDRNVCMLSDGSFNNWRPVGVLQLLEHAQTGILS